MDIQNPNPNPSDGSGGGPSSSGGGTVSVPKGETPTIVTPTPAKPVGAGTGGKFTPPPLTGGTPINPPPNPVRRSMSIAQQQTITTRAAGQRLPAIWGSNIRTGGIIGYENISAGYFVAVVAFCHGPIGAMTATIDGQNLANIFANASLNPGGGAYEIFLGTKSQALSTILGATVPAWTSSLPGIDYVVLAYGPQGKAPNYTSLLAVITQGLLVREPRENRFLWSGDLSNAAWTKGTGLTVAANGATPDGVTAWNVTDGSGTVESQFNQGTFTVANDNATHRLQFRILKTSGGTSKTFKVTFALSGGTGVSSTLYLNTDTGAVISGSGWTITTDPLNSSWWLCQGAVTNNTTGNTTLTIQFFPAAATFGSSTDDVAQQGTATVGMFQLTRLSSSFPSYGYTTATALVGSTDANGIPNQARAFSDNPALIWADARTSHRYGVGDPDSSIDWTGDVTTAANDCDKDIGSGVKRFVMGYKFDNGSALNPEAVTQIICQHAAMNEARYNGKWHVWVDKAQPSSGISFTDVGSSANIVDASFREKGQSEVFNRVRVHYVDFNNNYVDASAEDADPAVDAGTKEDTLAEYTLGVPAAQALRLAQQYRARSQKTREYFLTVLAEGTRVTPGLRFSATSNQWGNNVTKDLICTNIQNVGSMWQIRAEEYDATVYPA